MDPREIEGDKVRTEDKCRFKEYILPQDMVKGAHTKLQARIQPRRYQ